MQTSARPASGLGLLDSYIPLGGNQTRLYYALREAVPIIDAAIFKTVRLTGGFEVRCADERLQHKLDNFVRNVPVGGNQCGLESFVSTYFEQLLTCGTAVGEMVTDADGHIAALFNSPLENIELRRASDGVGVDIFSANATFLVSAIRVASIFWTASRSRVAFSPPCVTRVVASSPSRRWRRDSWQDATTKGFPKTPECAVT